MTTHTLPQPFASQHPATACPAGCRQGVQIVPVAGNADREIPAFVVYHGRGHLTAEGTVTSTPVHLTYAEADAARTLHRGADGELPLAERRILEDIIDRGISPRAILQRRHRTHIDSLVRKGLVKDVSGVSLAETGIVLVDEVAALVALGRACGDHDRPLPCLECAND